MRSPARRNRPLFDDVERARLCDLLDDLGPDVPTLLGSWTARDIAAHLILRERDPLAGPGLMLPGAWGRYAQRRQNALALTDFRELTATLRGGPPPGFFRIGWVRRIPSLNEFFVHHEDVRRANGLAPGRTGRPWTRRSGATSSAGPGSSPGECVAPGSSFTGSAFTGPESPGAFAYGPGGPLSGSPDPRANCCSTSSVGRTRHTSR
jgi:hypothetical protein